MNLDIVVIGRNSQFHLGECLQKIHEAQWSHGIKRIIYIDGHSTDLSLEIAQRFEGVESTTLRDPKASAAKGRNQGAQSGQGDLIQFIDSDVLIYPTWLEEAWATLKKNANIVAVRGHLKERYPSRNMFHFSASLEWDESVGPCQEMGGTVMIRRSAWENCEGYSNISSGEDPDLARRLVQNGGTIYQCASNMGVHDIAIDTFNTWFTRSVRTGWTYSAVGWMSLMRGDYFWMKEQLRIITRGCGALIALLAGLCLGQFPLGMVLAILLIFQPTLTSIPNFKKKFKLGWGDATTYSLTCSMVIIPQTIGAIKYWLSKVNTHVFIFSPLVLFLASCQNVEPQPDHAKSFSNVVSSDGQAEFAVEKDLKQQVFATSDAIKSLNGKRSEIYLIGSGDRLSLNVWNREKLSLPDITVGPDGTFQVPRIGLIKAEGRSCEDLNKEIEQKLASLYEKPEVNLLVTKYNNNRAYVLGRVTNPGLVNFQGRGTLLEALSLAGGLPILAKEAFLTRCAIIRGSEEILWINLKELLNGNMGLNAGIYNGDIIYIPESGDEMAYVMGEVRSPGAIMLKDRLSFLDALMMSGGPKKGADYHKAFLVRQNPEGRQIIEVDLAGMIERGDQSKNYLLRDNDIVFIAPSGISKFNALMNDSLPFLQVLSLGSSVGNSLGITKPANMN
jgi:polysaccharide biosynthesis/export protein